LDAVSIAVVDFGVRYGEPRRTLGQHPVRIYVVPLEVLVEGAASDGAIVTRDPDQRIVTAVVDSAALDAGEVSQVDLDGDTSVVFLVELEVLDGDIVTVHVEGVVTVAALPADLRAGRRGDDDGVRRRAVGIEVAFPLVVVARCQRIPDDVERVTGCARGVEIRL
jgi:hypothetical protein